MFEKKSQFFELPNGEVIPYDANAPYCPHVKWSCIKTKCVHYMGVQGQAPVVVEGKETMMDKTTYDCTFNWAVLGQFEIARQQRSNTAATESFRNTILQMQTENVSFLHALSQLVNGNNRKAITVEKSGEPN